MKFSLQIIISVQLILLMIHLVSAFNRIHYISKINAKYSNVRSSSWLMNAQEWHSVSVIENKQEAVGLNKLRIKANPTISASYLNAGQYVQMRNDPTQAKAGFFAVASGINDKADDVLTFLVKDTENTQYLTKAVPGKTLEMSTAQGKGFPVVEYFQKYKYDFAVTNVLMLACGSGIAPIAAVIDSGILNLGKPNLTSLTAAKATLYLGVKTEAHIPFRDRFTEWKSMGINIIPVLSKPSEGYTGRTGYIQDALRADTIRVPRNTGLLLCGQRGMVDDVKQQCLEAGVFEGRILLNF